VPEESDKMPSGLDRVGRVYHLKLLNARRNMRHFFHLYIRKQNVVVSFWSAVSSSWLSICRNCVLEAKHSVQEGNYLTTFPK